MLENLLHEAGETKSAGNDERAAELYQQAIQLCENDGGQAHYLALCLQELAAIYSEHNQVNDAIPLYHRLIGIGEQVLGPEHPDVIVAIKNLAVALATNAQYDESDQVFKLATGKAESALGISHPLSQQIRQEHYDTLANRDVVEKDKITHGLILGPASQTDRSPISTHSNPVVTPSSGARTGTNLKAVKKYSNLKQPPKIKKLRYVAESADEQAGSLLKLGNLRRRWREVFYVVSVILCIAAIAIALSKLFVPRDLPDPNVIARRLIEKGLFRSVDEVNGINFIDNKYAVFTNDVRHRKIPYFLMKGGMRDLWDMLVSMAIRKENWYQLKPDELTTEDGNVYYASGAPEFLLLKKMQVLADFARRYYTSNNCYPDKSEKLKGAPGLAYINPITNQPDLPVIKRLSASYTRDNIFSGIKADANPEECYTFLRHGGLWQGDTPGPGKITALSLFTSQRCADGYRVIEFYIHGFDRYGNLISAGKPETFYAIGMSQGQNLHDINTERMEEMERVSVHPPERIYVVPGDIVDLHYWRQCGANLLNAWVILSFMAWIFLESKKRRQNPTQPLKPVEILFLISLIIWGYITLIHVIP